MTQQDNKLGKRYFEELATALQSQASPYFVLFVKNKQLNSIGVSSIILALLTWSLGGLLEHRQLAFVAGFFLFFNGFFCLTIFQLVWKNTMLQQQFQLQGSRWDIDEQILKHKAFQQIVSEHLQPKQRLQAMKYLENVYSMDGYSLESVLAKRNGKSMVLWMTLGLCHLPFIVSVSSQWWLAQIIFASIMLFCAVILMHYQQPDSKASVEDILYGFLRYDKQSHLRSNVIELL